MPGQGRPDDAPRQSSLARVFYPPRAKAERPDLRFHDLRLTGAVLVETHDEWQVSAERRNLSERSMALVVNRSAEEVAKPELITA